MAQHPHALAMAEYAKDALDTTAPWERWEFSIGDETWTELLDHPQWGVQNHYRKKQPKWQPEGGEYYIDFLGGIDKGKSSHGTKEFGVERATEEQAKSAANEIRKFNRLLAFRDELNSHNGKTLKCDWECGLRKYFIVYDHIQKRWMVDYTTSRRLLGTVYFLTEESANKACEMLISGELEL